MAPCEPTDDYYAILEVEQTDTHDIIRKSYRRLAVLLHPDKNPSQSDATASFQRVSLSKFMAVHGLAFEIDADHRFKLLEAYETLSDPGTRHRYDGLWPGIRARHRTQQDAKKRQDETAAAERRKAAEEALHKQRQAKASQDRLQPLEQRRSQCDSGIFEINREIRRLQAELKRLRDKDEEERRKQREKNSWWSYFTSPIYGKALETEGEKLEREAEGLQRLASTSIKSNELKRKEAALQELESQLKIINITIAAEKKRYEDEVRARDSMRQAQLRQERLKQEWLRQEQLKQEQLRQEQLRQEQLRQQQEARRKEREQREREREAEVAAALQRQRQEEAARATQRARAAKEAQEHRQATRGAGSTPTPSTCRHKAYWAKLEGSRSCSNCHTLQRRFTFQCPGCKIIACANCRQMLKGKPAKKNENRSQQYSYSPDAYADDGDYYGYEYD